MKPENRLCIRDQVLNGSQDPAAPAIESPGREPLTYRDLREQIVSVVRYLNARGLHRNDRIAMVMPNGPDAVVAMLAVAAGFTVVPLNSQYREPEFSAYFARLGIRAVFVEGKNIPAGIAAAARDIPVIEVCPSSAIAGRFTLFPKTDTGGTEPVYAEPEDIITIKMTSGTTANPKQVPVSQTRFFLGMQKLNAAVSLSDRDRNLNFLPLDTGIGFDTTLGGTLLTGGSLICLREFIAPDLPDLLRTCRPTYFWGGPAHHHAIVRELKKGPRIPRADHSLRLIWSGSAAIQPATHRDLETLLDVQVVDVYVMSEAYISQNIPCRQGSVGIPFAELEIWDDRNCALPAGRSGEIVVRGDLVFNGYLDAPEENAAGFSNGWFRTGDIGYRDSEGYLFLAGRKKEMINKGGRKIAPVEIDTVLAAHPGVRDAMTFAVSDPALGEDVAAMVVPADDTVTEAHLRQYLLDRLAPFKVPRKISLVDAIPRNPAGKPLRHEGTRKFP